MKFSGRFCIAWSLIGGMVALGIGCQKPSRVSNNERTPPQNARVSPIPSKEATAAELVETAISSLQVAGIPEPPTAIGATRQQREEYLLATENARNALLQLVNAKTNPPAPNPVLVPEINQSEIMALSAVLAVDLCDAIDRSDAKRVEQSLRAAIAYSDFLSLTSIAGWRKSGAVSDTIAQALKSVSEQLDAQITETIDSTCTALEQKGPNPANTIQLESERLSRWLASMKETKDLVPVDQFLRSGREGVQSRSPMSPDIEKAIQRKAIHGKLKPEFVVSEAQLAFDLAMDAIQRHQAVEIPDIKDHPLAAIFLGTIRPDIDVVPFLSELRKENLRLIALTARILASGSPDDLSAFKDQAVSPVNKLPFVYKKNKSGFELDRPRPKS